MKEKNTTISAFGWSLFVGLVLFVVMSVQSMVNGILTLKAIQKINLETADMRRCEKENELFWGFISDLDTMSDTSEVMKNRDDLYDVICEL